MGQGLPGSFSEDAALKAYPNCQTVPCDEFEDTFKVLFHVGFNILFQLLTC